MMSFWGKDDWKVTVEDEKHIVLHGPGVDYIFDKHDFLQLQKNVNAIDLFEKEEWVIHDDTIISRSTGEQLIGVIDDCAKLNELHKEKEQYKSLAKDYQKTVRHQAKLLAEASKQGYFPPIPEGATYHKG